MEGSGAHSDVLGVGRAGGDGLRDPTRNVKFAVVAVHRFWLVASEHGLVGSVGGDTVIWPCPGSLCPSWFSSVTSSCV